MLIKKLNDEILGEDDKPISNSVLSINNVISLLRQTNISNDDKIEMLEKQKKKNEKITLKIMLMRSANFIDPEDKSKKTPEETFKRYEIFQKIKKSNGQVELQSEDCTSLKEGIAMMTGYGVSVIIAGQVIEKLEQKK
ncbi:MAG: hypothetical protein GWP19_00410 [Planctomycetia bacterium]|nr:hypothetical protein [Planctomycetia bacterium]